MKSKKDEGFPEHSLQGTDTTWPKYALNITPVILSPATHSSIGCQPPHPNSPNPQKVGIRSLQRWVAPQYNLCIFYCIYTCLLRCVHKNRNKQHFNDQTVLNDYIQVNTNGKEECCRLTYVEAENSWLTHAEVTVQDSLKCPLKNNPLITFEVWTKQNSSTWLRQTCVLVDQTLICF